MLTALGFPIPARGKHLKVTFDWEHGEAGRLFEEIVRINVDHVPRGRSTAGDGAKRS